MEGYVVGTAVVCVAVAVVISVVIIVHGRWKKVGEGRLLYNLVPRFFLLRAFYEILPKLPSLYVGAEWENVCNRIKKDLGEIERAVGQDAISEESDERKIDPRVRTKCVAEAIDKHLVPFLQSQTQLAELLDGYLPDFQQSWRDLLNRELDETEKKLVGLNKPACPGEQLDAVKACGMLVASFIQDLGEINLTIEAATRGSLRIAYAYFKKEPTMYKEVKVFYATDRHVTEDGEYIGQRTLSRDGGLHYGYMVVGIPDCHKPGYVESPLANEEADPLKHVVILSINTKMRADKGRFLTKLNDELQKEEYQPVGEVLLFIHGYNVQHKDAIMRAAQVKFDLNFKGVAIAYSWSSKGALWGYDHDQEEVKNTVPSLQSFIKSILSEVPHATKVHILAHSMGNRALIQALRKLQQEQLFTRHATLKNVIFAAADEERKRFDELVHDLHQRNPQSKCPHFTVYSSKDDWALFTSKFLHGRRSRLGDTLSLFETDSNDCSTDVVDASGTDASSWLCHSYYGRVPDVLKDMHLLLDDWSAKDRSSCEDPLIRAVTFRERDFYAFRQTIWGVAVASGTGSTIAVMNGAGDLGTGHTRGNLHFRLRNKLP